MYFGQRLLLLHDPHFGVYVCGEEGKKMCFSHINVIELNEMKNTLTKNSFT